MLYEVHFNMKSVCKKLPHDSNTTETKAQLQSPSKLRQCNIVHNLLRR